MSDRSVGLWRKIHPIVNQQDLTTDWDSVTDQSPSEGAVDPNQRWRATKSFETDQRRGIAESTDKDKLLNFPLCSYSLKSDDFNKSDIHYATKEGQRISELRSKKVLAWEDPFKS